MGCAWNVDFVNLVVWRGALEVDGEVEERRREKHLRRAGRMDHGVTFSRTVFFCFDVF